MLEGYVGISMVGNGRMDVFFDQMRLPLHLFSLLFIHSRQDTGSLVFPVLTNRGPVNQVFEVVRVRVDSWKADRRENSKGSLGNVANCIVRSFRLC